MPYDVFISHSKEDKLTAQAICARLEAEHVRCWIAPRDIPAGSDWAESIIKGLNGCRVMVLVFSSTSNESPQVKREVQRAFEKGLVVMPFRIEDVSPNQGLEYYIGSVHWLDALTPPLDSHIGALLLQTKAVLDAKHEPADRATTETPRRAHTQERLQAAPRPETASGHPAKKWLMIAGLTVLCLLAMTAAGMQRWMRKTAEQKAFRESLLKIISSADNHFEDIRGEYIGKSGFLFTPDAQSDYASKISLPESARTVIGVNPIGTLYYAHFFEHTSDYPGAKAKYDELLKALGPALSRDWVPTVNTTDESSPQTLWKASGNRSILLTLNSDSNKTNINLTLLVSATDQK
jgi:hypothetical protein